MFTFFKFFHFIGLTLFLGSIWVYIAQGTPMDFLPITHYARENVAHLISTLTLPGLMMMIFSGFFMALCRKELFKKTFFKIKLFISIMLLINTIYIFKIAKKSAILMETPSFDWKVLADFLHQETVFGAVNVVFILFLVGYSLCYKKIEQKKKFRFNNGRSIR